MMKNADTAGAKNKRWRVALQRQASAELAPAARQAFTRCAVAAE
jgi:hypothetical protein